MGQYSIVEKDVKLGKNVKIRDFTNIYGCEIGDETKIAAFVEIRRGVKIGKKCKIEPFVFIPEGVTIEDEVFIGPGVCFTNDKNPRATTPDHKLKTAEDWVCLKTRVKKGASIGAGAIILPGTTIGEHALIGSGSVVTKDIPPYKLALGVPARIIGDVPDKEEIVNAQK